MKLRFIVAALAALIAPACAIAEQQSPAHTPQVSETDSAFVTRLPNTHQNWDNIAKWELNPALRALASNNYGSSCSAVPTPYPGQICIDATERAVKLYTAPVGSSIFTWNTLATIGSDGKLSQSGALNFKGSWNATTNSPALVSSVGTAGDYYVVTTAGTTTLNGVSSWSLGDEAVFASGAWIKIPGAAPVQSVAGLTGTISAAALGAALNPLASPTFHGDIQALDSTGGFVGNYLWAQGPTPKLYMYQFGSDSLWRWHVDGLTGGTIHFAACATDESICNDAWSLTRSGATPTGLLVPIAATFSRPITGTLAPPAGVVGDGSTDNCTPLNAALQLGPVHLPRPASITGFYRTSCTILVPLGSALYGEGIASFNFSGIVGGVEIRCDNGVMICVQVGENAGGNKSVEVSHIKAGRAGGSPPAGSVGVKMVGGAIPRLDAVVSDNHAACFLLKTPPGTNSGLSAQLTRIQTGDCTDVHVWNDSFPEVRIESSRFGFGGNHANAYLRMSCSQRNCSGAGTPSGWFINNSQFNSGNIASYPDTLFDFSNASDNSAQFFGGDWGEVNMSDCHIEMVNHMVTSDSSFYQIKFFQMSNNTVATLGTLFALNANTNIWRWNLTGNHFSSVGTSVLNMPAAASTANIQDLMWTGGTYYGSLTLTGVGAATAYIANVSWGGDLTINGSFQAFNETGDNISGSYSEAITGPGSPPNVTVVNNRKLKHTGVTGVTCGSVSAGTLTSWNGIITHC